MTISMLVAGKSIIGQLPSFVRKRIDRPPNNWHSCLPMGDVLDFASANLFLATPSKRQAVPIPIGQMLDYHVRQAANEVQLRVERNDSKTGPGFDFFASHSPRTETLVATAQFSPDLSCLRLDVPNAKGRNLKKETAFTEFDLFKDISLHMKKELQAAATEFLAESITDMAPVGTGCRIYYGRSASQIAEFDPHRHIAIENRGGSIIVRVPGEEPHKMKSSPVKKTLAMLKPHIGSFRKVQNSGEPFALLEEKAH